MLSVISCLIKLGLEEILVFTIFYWEHHLWDIEHLARVNSASRFSFQFSRQFHIIIIDSGTTSGANTTSKSILNILEDYVMLLNSVPIFWCVEQYRKQHNKIMNFTFTLFLISILDLRLSERGHSLLRCFSSIGKICLNWWWPSHLISFFFYFLLFESFVTIIGLTLRLVPCFFMCQHYTTYRILTDRIETAYFITWPHTGFWITRATYISSLNIYCAYVYSLSVFVSLTGEQIQRIYFCCVTLL